MDITSGNKVALIGTGMVGSTYAYALLNQGICDELVLIDVNEAKARGDVMDLNHALVNAPSSTTIRYGTSADCSDAAIAVLCAGPAMKPGETRLDLIAKNLKITEVIVKSIMGSGFNGIFLIATNPVDILSYATWKFSGLPKQRVIGSGTVLDSARFRYLLGEEFNVDPKSVHAYIIGEHGDSQLPVWSSANIFGKRIDQKLTEQRKNEIFGQARDAAYAIKQAKGATYYGIAMALARITKAILANEKTVLAVSSLLEGEYGVEDVYIGVPTVIDRYGSREIVSIELSDAEQKGFAASADILQGIQWDFFTG